MAMAQRNAPARDMHEHTLLTTSFDDMSAVWERRRVTCEA